jgi:hypothetical protein
MKHMWIRKSLLLLGTILATQAGAQFYYQDVLQVAKNIGTVCPAQAAQRSPNYGQQL